MLQVIKNMIIRDHLHDIVECLVAALDARDIYTSGHSTRVGDMSMDLARAIGIGGQKLESLHMAAHLHDIGKLGVPESILFKKGQLSSDEYKQIQRHPEIGYHILSRSKELKHLADVVLCHHERWDGKGYPNALQNSKIPLGARIIAVADSMDAITSKRSYREAMSWERGMEELWNNSGTQFDPLLVQTAEKLWQGWEKRYSKAPVPLTEKSIKLMDQNITI